MQQEKIVNNTSPGFGYTGEVSTKVIKNNRVLKSSKGKNKGLYKLFTALCYALADVPQTNVMPARVVLYTYTEDSVQTAALSSGAFMGTAESTILNQWDNINLDIALTALTAPLMYTAVPYLTVRTLEDGSKIPETTFTFKIPYNVVGKADSIKLAVLYPNKSNKTINFSDALAFHFLDSAECAPPEGKDNAHLLLEWTMYFNNAKTSTNGIQIGDGN